ncbi:MAG TPA: hypothetical protein VIC33_11195, partial [Vicinamibacterales bacterium]
LACAVADGESPSLYFLCNASSAPVTFTLPVSPKGPWHLVADTSREPPEDIRDLGAELALDPEAQFTLPARASAVLTAHGRHRTPGRRARAAAQGRS